VENDRTVHVTILLDTSAFRSISTADIQFGIREGSDVAISSFTVWELLCHLDEPEFDRRRGLLLKARHVRILDDPAADWDAETLPIEDRVHRRVKDPDFLALVLDRLDKSRTLAAFYASPLLDPAGDLRDLSNCSARTRTTLDDAFPGFEHLMQGLGRLTEKSADAESRLDLDSDGGFHNAVLNWVNSRTIVARQRGSTRAQEELFDLALDHHYMAGSQVFETARDVIANPNRNYRNDLEDGIIATHFRISVPMTFVVGDRAFRSRLERTRERMRRLDMEHPWRVLDEPSWLAAISRSPADAC